MKLPAASATVILKEFADGAVLYCTRTEVYFGLNEVGVAVWKGLPPVHDEVETLVVTLRARFPEATEATIRADVIEFLDQLVENDLALRPDMDADALTAEEG